MKRKLPPRIWVLMASEARIAAILRRGPSRQVQLIKWRLDMDTFEEGQWFKGRIYERRCGLSPDGKYLIYFAATYKGPIQTWTAISKPPYFSALALWPKGDAWNGGGYFTGRKVIHLDHPARQAEPHPDFKLRAGHFRIASLAQWGGEDNPVWNETRTLDGWKFETEGKWIRGHPEFSFSATEPEIWSKPHKSRKIRLAMEIHGVHQRNGPWYCVRYRLFSDTGDLLLNLGFIDWADWDHNGSLLYAADGCIYRQRFAGRKLANPLKLVDLTGNQFQSVPPPPKALKIE